LISNSPNRSDETTKTVLKAATVSFAGQLYQLGMSLVSGVIIARLIGPAPYGVFNLTRTICETTSLVTKAGFDLAVVRYLGERQHQLDASTTVLVCRRVVLAVLVLGAIPVMLVVGGAGALLERTVYRYEGFALALLAMSLAVPFMSVLQVLGGIFRGYLRIAPRVVGELILQPTLRLVIFLGLFAVISGLWAVIWGTVASFVIAAACLSAWAYAGILRRPKEAVAPAGYLWGEITGISRYGVVLSGSVLMSFMMSRADVMLLGYFVDADHLGQYAIAQMIAGLLASFNLALGQAASPIIADLARRQQTHDLGRVLHQHARWVAMTTVPLFLVLLLYGDKLVNLLGPSYVPDAPVIAILALSQLSIALFSSAGYALSMTGRHITEFRVLSIGVAVSVAVNLALIPGNGITGAAVAGLIGGLVANILRATSVYKIFGVFPLGIDLLRPVLICTAVFAVVYWIQLGLVTAGTIPVVLGCVGVSIGIYTVLLLLVGLAPDDRRLLRAACGRFIALRGL